MIPPLKYLPQFLIHPSLSILQLSPKSSTSASTTSSPPVTSTVIAVIGRRLSRDSIPTSPPFNLARRSSSNTMPVGPPMFPSSACPAVAEALMPTTDTLEQETRSHTHIIRVSGPANVDRERSTSEVPDSVSSRTTTSATTSTSGEDQSRPSSTSSPTPSCPSQSVASSKVIQTCV
jgi:hypothetical protein